MLQPNCFKDLSFFDRLPIPTHKPPAHYIMQDTIIPTIENYHIIETPKGRCYEGVTLTGLKLFIQILLNEKLTYAAYTQEQSMHAIHYNYTKTLHLTLPLMTHGIETRLLVESGHLTLLPVIKTIYTQPASQRMIYRHGLLMVTGTFSSIY